MEVIERNVLAQTKLIDDLLDVSRIITGKLRLQLRAAVLSDVIDAAIEAMRPAAEAKEIQVRSEKRLRPGEDRVVGDPDRLQQIIWNLISNAIKFTPARGRVSVELSPERPARLEDHSGRLLRRTADLSVRLDEQLDSTEVERAHVVLGDIEGSAIPILHLVGARRADEQASERLPRLRLALDW